MSSEPPLGSFQRTLAWAPYEARFPVRFGSCDPAKIIYFPNYFDFFHAAMEDFFRDRLGVLYHVLLAKERISFPTVHLEVDFSAPVSYGDEVRIAVEVAKVGRSSLAFRYTGYRSSDGARVVESTATTVCTDLDRFASVPLPDTLRASLEREERAAKEARASSKK
ncbi:acyl-CoA thioesterase [bacterium]|nr:acyl-CoA thioesterase [bacterium]